MNEFIAVLGLAAIWVLLRVIESNNRAEMIEDATGSATCSDLPLGEDVVKRYTAEERDGVVLEFEAALKALQADPAVRVNSKNTRTPDIRTLKAVFSDGTAFIATIAGIWGKDGGTATVTRIS